MSAILVTGAAGFIGFHLSKKLIDLNYKVVGLDNINSYYDPNLKLARLEELGIKKDSIKENKLIESTISENFKFIKIDLEDYEGLSSLFENNHISKVVNLAAQPGVRYSLENPHAYINSNINGFLNILEVSRHFKIKHLVYASSSSVYGMNDKIPYSVSDNVDHPMSLYAATKKSNELMAHTYSHLYDIPTTGLRFFTVYGPWGRPDMALFLFTESIFKNKNIKVFNEGNLRRDFTYIDDIVEGIINVLVRAPKRNDNINNDKIDPSNSSAPYKIYNIGNNAPVKLLDFINAIEEEIGVDAKKEFLPMQPGDVYKTWADCSGLENDFSYKPQTDIKKGIAAFVKWYRTYYQI